VSAPPRFSASGREVRHDGAVRHLQEDLELRFRLVEAVEDITHARKRLIHLTANEPVEYRLWDSARQMFVEPMEDCTRAGEK
jgi:hypothetical protein